MKNYDAEIVTMNLYLIFLCRQLLLMAKGNKSCTSSQPRTEVRPSLSWLINCFEFPCMDGYGYADQGVWELYFTVLPAWSFPERPVFASTVLKIKLKNYFINDSF